MSRLEDILSWSFVCMLLLAYPLIIYVIAALLLGASTMWVNSIILFCYFTNIIIFIFLIFLEIYLMGDKWKN